MLRPCPSRQDLGRSYSIFTKPGTLYDALRRPEWCAGGRWRASGYNACLQQRREAARPRCKLSRRPCGALGEGSGSPAGDDLPSNVQQQQWVSDTLKRMLMFMLPAMVLPMSDPLMSLVDTVCIGQFAGTRDLAALGPANLILAFTQYVFQSLQVATISLVSGKMRSGKHEGASQVITSSLCMALAWGLLMCAVLQVAAEVLLGMTGAHTALLPLSCDYLRVRVLAQPAVMVIMISQASLIAQRDTLTPLISVLLSTCVSLLGNLVFVAWLGYGLAGAAWTTVATQYVGATTLVLALMFRAQVRPRRRLPRADDLAELFLTMGPLTIAYLCKNLCYIIIQTSAASLATLQLAAHQAVFTIWNLCAFTTAPLEQAALTFVPAAGPGWQQAATARVVLLMGALGGLLCGVISSAVPLLLPHLVTRDPAIWPLMASVAPQLLLSMLVIGTDVAATAILVTRKDLDYIARSFVITLASLALLMSYSQQQGWGLAGVWWGIVYFFSARFVQSVSRLVWLQRSEHRAA